jgi:hypothetical protein
MAGTPAGVDGVDNGGVDRRLLLLIALWAAATVFGLAFAELTKVGPVVLRLTHGHGVHVGDLVALAVAYTAAAWLSRRVLRRT